MMWIILFLSNFCPDDLSSRENGVFISSLINGLMLICVFKPSTCFMKLGSPASGAYIFRIELCLVSYSPDQNESLFLISSD